MECERDTSPKDRKEAPKNDQEVRALGWGFSYAEWTRRWVGKQGGGKDVAPAQTSVTLPDYDNSVQDLRECNCYQHERRGALQPPPESAKTNACGLGTSFGVR